MDRPSVPLGLLFAATLLVLYGCGRILSPFWAPLLWALAFYVAFVPLQRRLERRIFPSMASALTVVAVGLGLVLPLVFVSERLVSHVAAGIGLLTSEAIAARWEAALVRHDGLRTLTRWIGEHFDIRGWLEQAAATLPTVLQGSAWLVADLAVMLFALFFLLRDRRRFGATLRALVPLRDDEWERITDCLHQTIRATLMGKLLVSAAQGAMAGLMFWTLGVPAPLVWSLAMTVLALIPFAGAFVVWVPATIYLALMGQPVQATVLGLWGLIVVSNVDNVLYPYLVGRSLEMHPLTSLLSVIGGVVLLGLSGVILGPLLFALGEVLVEISRDRYLETSVPRLYLEGHPADGGLAGAG